MRIEKIEVITLRRHWGPPENGVTRDWPIVLVHADNGLVGISRGGSASLIDQEFAPLLIGADARRITMLWQQMYETAWRFRGPGRSAMSTIGAIDVALWDLSGVFWAGIEIELMFTLTASGILTNRQQRWPP